MLVRLLLLIMTFSLISACGSGGSDSPSIATPDFLFIKGQTVISGNTGNPVTFDASTSYSTAASPLTFTWSTQNAGVTLTDPSTPIQTFTPSAAGIYELQLVLTDENNVTETATFSAYITDSGTNSLPIATAGADQHVKIGSLIHLDATQSSDTDILNPITYSWSIDSKPSGSSITLSDSTIAQPTFTPDLTGTYTFSLTVNDGTADSNNSATTSIIATSVPVNSIPHASAGIDQTTQPHHQVDLSALGSHDSDNDPLSYIWSITSQPTNSTPTLSPTTDAHPSFNANTPGHYVITLIANDGTTDSTPDTITITVVAPAEAQHSTSTLSQLMLFGLDSTDAHYILANHESEALAVLAKTDKIFQGITIIDDMFEDASDTADATVFNDPQIIPWTDAYKTRFRKVFGRIKFAVNTDHFETAFTAQYASLVLSQNHQGDLNFWQPYPADFAAYKSDFTADINTHASAFKFFISDRESGVAYGGRPLKLKMESKMMRDQVASSSGNKSPTPMNDTAALLFHELNHSIGYDHHGQLSDQSDVILKPNNIPYFVQIILGYNADTIESYYCRGDLVTCAYQIDWNNPKSILTEFFGPS